MSPFLSPLLLLLLFTHLSFSHNFLYIPLPAPLLICLHPSSAFPPPAPLSSNLLLLDTGSHQIFMLLEQGPDCSNTHITVSRFVKVCVWDNVCACVYYLYIRWFSASAGIANMFLNISCEIVWNSLVSDDNDSLTALSGPWRFHDNTHSHAHKDTLTLNSLNECTWRKHSKTHSCKWSLKCMKEPKCMSADNVDAHSYPQCNAQIIH